MVSKQCIGINLYVMSKIGDDQNEIELFQLSCSWCWGEIPVDEGSDRFMMVFCNLIQSMRCLHSPCLETATCLPDCEPELHLGPRSRRYRSCSRFIQSCLLHFEDRALSFWRHINTGVQLAYHGCADVTCPPWTDPIRILEIGTGRSVTPRGGQL